MVRAQRVCTILGQVNFYPQMGGEFSDRQLVYVLVGLRVMHVLRDVCASAIQVATELMRSKMNDEILDALLAGFPLPSLAIDRTERIIAANIEALTLINQQARGQNYVTMLRQPALLDAIETTLTDGKARSTQYLSNDGAQDTAFRVSCRAVQGLGRGAGRRRAGLLRGYD